MCGLLAARFGGRMLEVANSQIRSQGFIYTSLGPWSARAAHLFCCHYIIKYLIVVALLARAFLRGSSQKSFLFQQ